MPSAKSAEVNYAQASLAGWSVLASALNLHLFICCSYIDDMFDKRDNSDATNIM
jgi:hypothetical protein